MKKKPTSGSKTKSSSKLFKSARISPKQDQKKAAIKRRIRQNRPLHKKLILHPLTIMAVLCAAVFIVSWTFHAVADYYTLTATIPAAPLTQGAIITSPYDSAVINSTPVEVTGTCDDSSYVNLYLNSTFSGVAWCSSSNTFSITTDLFIGQNTLMAQDYNVTNSPGPTSPTITVTYVPPTASTIPSTNNTDKGAPITSQPTTQPVSQQPTLFIGSDFHYQTVAPGDTYSWTVQVNGGSSPYTLVINWGDGQISRYTSSDPTFTITHKFSQSGYYPIIVNVTDRTGSKSLVQLAALVRKPGSPGVFKVAGTNTIQPSSKSGGGNGGFLKALGNIPEWLKFAWPSLIIVSLMLFSFWLGEKQEFHLFTHKHHRAH